MQYNTQKNPLWGNKIMTEGTDQYNKKWKDRLKDYGCFLTAIANIEQERSGIEFFPSKLNELVKKHNGYFWLAKDENNKIKYYGKEIETSEKNASFLFMPVLENILLFNFTGWLNPKNYIKAENTYWIARIENQWGGHYINVLSKAKDYFICFDTLTGLINLLEENKITCLHKIKFLYG